MEASLDIEYIMAMGALIETWFWSNPNTPSFNEAPFLNWLYDMGNRSDVPYVNSVSYGEDENRLTRAYVKSEGRVHETSLFASGDSGVGIWKSAIVKRNFVPDYPESSPWVTAVGGTQLSFSNNEEANSISGGGFSNYAPRPSWQDEAVKAYIVAGTSCAAPTVAGIISLLNDLRFQVGKPQLGFLNPFIYQTANKYPQAFNDITSGSNPGCGTSGFPATKGWDPVTGWGSTTMPSSLKSFQRSIDVNSLTLHQGNSAPRC
ncbi:polynucleotide 3'-phosphatase [Balamuthia mandrillaris]